jgi:hypothetical protein
LRLFRQTSVGDWDGVFARLEAALADWLVRGRGAERIGRSD